MNEETGFAPATRKTQWATRLAPKVASLTEFTFGRRALPNASKIHPQLKFEHWPVVSDGRHNLTTDMIEWNGVVYLVHSSSPWHIASTDSRLVVWRSTDLRSWTKVRDFQLPNSDIRDPKFAVINDRLFLYVLRNVGFVAEPSSTSYFVSDDGDQWSSLKESPAKGWIFWRAKTFDGKNWYMPAYWNQHGKSALFHSTDGESWKFISQIHSGDHNDETDIEFLPDGRMVATARLEGNGSFFGHPECATLICEAEPPYTTWKSKRCYVTRLDGPNLFSHEGKLYALGRHHLDAGRWLRHRGGALGWKRTALYRVDSDRLVHLSDLPSCGDTGYPGLIKRGDDLYTCYYTNDIQRDFRWGVGLFLPSEIRMAKLSLKNLSDLSIG